MIAAIACTRRASGRVIWGPVAQRAQSGDCYGTCFIGYLMAGIGCYPCYAKSILQNALLRVG